jgi:tight adherence protein C
MKRPMSERDLALADASNLMSICLAGGASHREAIKWVANRATSSHLEELALLSEAVESGASVQRACEIAEQTTDHARFREFVIKLNLSNQLGTPLQQQLEGFANTMRLDWLSEFRAIGVRAETRMLLPQVTLTLPMTILFSLYPSLQLLNGTYI